MPETAIRRPASLAGVAARLAGANVLGAASGFVTGPLLARALGASGRGDLAAITVPLSLAPPILGLGIAPYAYRAIARGRSLGEVIGSLGLPLALLGLAGLLGAAPAAGALAGGRETVRTMLTIGFAIMPLSLLGALLSGCLGALGLWRRVFIVNLMPFAVSFFGITICFALGRLTVTAAAIFAIAGSALALGPGLPLLFRQRTRVRPSLSREAASWGLRSWIGGLALLTNARLDQFLMITAVAPRELGLYAVAVTIAGAAGLAAGGLGPPLMARVAGGERTLMAQAVRMMLISTVAINLLLVAATPVLLHFLFGPEFRDAYPMVLILLAAQIPYCGAQVLSSALQADGAPLIPTIGEIIAVVITVAGLSLVLPTLGGVGAALVSLGAYGASFLFQVIVAHRRTGVPIARFLVPSVADAVWARGRVGDLTGALGFGS